MKVKKEVTPLYAKIDPKLKEKVEEKASGEGMSLTALVTKLFEEYLKR